MIQDATHTPLVWRKIGSRTNRSGQFIIMEITDIPSTWRELVVNSTTGKVVQTVYHYFDNSFYSENAMMRFIRTKRGNIN